ncbi:energy-coupling factor transport system permease protein [Cytobacillus firmus]|uniref:Energy-coupling factor transport system permease protein n=2 Tax=Cytobacillus TaxID=2675230 RepID=A0A366JTP5_CYTFI|nr:MULTISPECIES: energy-coupling factor transporter transmembrane component T [Cytobacillus]RBP92338.1 energy-coupling factor transport system permease protein [Cytobacillus firmus]TDX41977.1 energy-coupling factor transport system permease protein [Cytobacillus oceanisediminis]
MLLHEFNPSIKALTVIVCVLILSLFFDPVTPFLTLVVTAGATFIFGKVSFKRWILLFSPFIFMAIIYIWSALIFSKTIEGETILWTWGIFTLTEEGFQRALSLGMRVLSFTSLSLLFILTTKPTEFLLSLMQQCRLSPKLAYGIMAGYRFLPLMKDEFEIIRSAHRIRGIPKARTLSEKIAELKRYSVPLLAGAIRKAERTAMAMESKGFTGDRNRDFYQKISVSWKDWAYFAFFIGAVLASAYISWLFGFLQLYNGEL